MSKVKCFLNNGTGQIKGIFSSNKPWLDLQYHDSSRTSIKKPAELEDDMTEPPSDSINEKILDRIQGSMIGMALGDSLGAHVEFRPHQYMVQNPVTDLEGGGTWGLQKGQFTDDTSMALCLANSLVAQSKFNLYDQLVRYKWWYKNGYMSSTGECFDIGAATMQSINEFERRQNCFAQQHDVPVEHMDYVSDEQLLSQFDVYCSENEVAGNGALMRLAPVPLFFFLFPQHAVEYSGRSGQITHGDAKAYDACRYYGALIVAALMNYKKEEILDKQFYSKHKSWFSGKPLCAEIKLIAEGSYQRAGGYKDGIRGKGYIVNALEAALWAFWSDKGSFEKGALAAVNLGDDTDTTAAIYGQLAGAYYGYKKLPQRWLKHVYAKKFMLNLSQWIAYEGAIWQPSESISSFIPTSSSQPPLRATITEPFAIQPNSNIYYSQSEAFVPVRKSFEYHGTSHVEENSNRPNLRISASEASQNYLFPMEPSTMNQGSFNSSHMDSYSAYQAQPGGINTTLLPKKLNSNQQPSMIQTSTFSSTLPQHYETTSVKNNLHGPMLATTYLISSKEQPVASSTRTSNQGPPIHDDKKSQSTSKSSSQATNVKTHLMKATSDGYSSKNLSFIPSSDIPESSSKQLSQKTSSRSRHRLSDIFHSRKGSKSPALHRLVRSTTINGSNQAESPIDNNVNSKNIRESVPHEQSPAMSKPNHRYNLQQADEQSQKGKPPSGQNKNKSDTQYSNQPSKGKYSLV